MLFDMFCQCGAGGSGTLRRYSITAPPEIIVLKMRQMRQYKRKCLKNNDLF